MQVSSSAHLIADHLVTRAPNVDGLCFVHQATAKPMPLAPNASANTCTGRSGANTVEGEYCALDHCDYSPRSIVTAR